jgi:DNA-binding NarL/FixJ family response regulator
MRRPRLLLAEDYAPVAAQLRALLASEFDVVAVVADGFALLGAAQALSPDVVVADVEMPGLDGIRAAERLLGAAGGGAGTGAAAPAPASANGSGWEAGRAEPPHVPAPQGQSPRGQAHVPRVVLVTVHNEPALVKRAFDAGVSAYVLKIQAGEELVPAIHAALRGERFASPMVFGGGPTLNGAR